MRLAERRAHDQPTTGEQPSHAVHHADLERGFGIKVGQQARQAGGKHGLTGAGWADQEKVVASGGSNFDRTLGV